MLVSAKTGFIQEGSHFFSLVSLRILTTSGRFFWQWTLFCILTREITFMTLCLVSYTPALFWKGVHSNGRNLIQRRGILWKHLDLEQTRWKYFPFRVEEFKRVISPKKVSCPLKNGFVLYLWYTFRGGNSEKMFRLPSFLISYTLKEKGCVVVVVCLLVCFVCLFVVVCCFFMCFFFFFFFVFFVVVLLLLLNSFFFRRGLVYRKANRK